MAKVWKVIALGEGSAKNPPFRNWFLVAAADQYEAAEVVRLRRNLLGFHQRLEVLGEASAEFLNWAGAEDMKPGEVRDVEAFS